VKTEDEFFAALSKMADGKWQAKDGQIRHDAHHCPWLAVARTMPASERKRPRHLFEAYGETFLRDVARAADNAEGHDPRLRQRLVETLL
jgi:hypothetical protein